VNRGLIFANKTYHPVVQINVLPGSNLSNKTVIQEFDWKIVDFTPNYMDVQIDWKQYPDVSIHPAMDLLQVNFVAKQYFKASDGQMFPDTTVT